MTALPEPIRTEDGGTLRIVRNANAPTDHLGVAARHIEAAIAHINDVAQTRVPMSSADSSDDVDELRLIGRALADIHDALRERPAHG